MKDFSNEIWAYALKNAIEYDSAEAGKILPKLFQHKLDKKDIRLVMPKISEIVKKVNSLSKDEREKEFEKYKKYAKEREEHEKGLPELENVGKNMVFRLAPYPSGALHIGNAKTYLLNALYAQKYNAKILLVMDDTIGSEDKQIMPESYKLLEDAFLWLGIKYEKPVIYKSNRLDIYYQYADKLIEKGKAYVCHCLQKTLHDNRVEGKECEHRNISIEEQKKRWKKMFDAKEGTAVLRLKTSMQDPNPAFRDRVLFKISDRKHPRIGSKYRVWPTLEMNWAIDDHLLGITHILRGNDLAIETDMEKYIWDIFGWKHPETIHTALIRIDGIENKISKSKAQKEVKSGQFSGWDDPRTWSIQSLKRRGIRKEAILEFVKGFGINRQDITVPIESLYSINRKMADSDADRYSFASEPVEIKIKNAPKIKNISVQIHPDKKEKRKIEIGKSIFISKQDFENLKGKEIRLLHLYNIKLDKSKKEGKFTSIDNKDIPKINWVSIGEKVKILMPDGKLASGLAEKAVKNIKVDSLIQFERFGFVRCDKNGQSESEFWFAHR
ncbi:MAG: glutamate--tRNA ligase [Nanoarchaeota archaeon]